MSATAMELELRALGHDCRIEARERLAVIVAEMPLRPDTLSALRRDALRLSHANGFSHVALEIPLKVETDAGVSRD